MSRGKGRAQTRTGGTPVRQTDSGRTGRTRNLGSFLAGSYGPCDSDGQATGRQFTAVTWDDGTDDTVDSDTLDGNR